MKIYSRIQFLFLSVMMVSMIYGQAQNGTEWKADVSHSNLGFKVKHNGISNTVGDFRDFDLTIVTTGDDFSEADVSMVIQAGSINTANESRDEHLRSSDFFDTKKYPEIVFKSNKVYAQGENEFLLEGTLSMHGVTKPLSLTMKYNGTIKRRGTDVAGLYFSATFNRLDFLVGEELSTEMVANEIRLNAEIEIVNK